MMMYHRRDQPLILDSGFARCFVRFRQSRKQTRMTINLWLDSVADTNFGDLTDAHNEQSWLSSILWFNLRKVLPYEVFDRYPTIKIGYDTIYIH